MLTKSYVPNYGKSSKKITGKSIPWSKRYLKCDHEMQWSTQQVTNQYKYLPLRSYLMLEPSPYWVRPGSLRGPRYWKLPNPSHEYMYNDESFNTFFLRFDRFADAASFDDRKKLGFILVRPDDLDNKTPNQPISSLTQRCCAKMSTR